MQPFGLLVLRVRVMGEVRVDLDRDVAVAPAGLLPDRAQQVAGRGDVGACELEEDLLRAQLARKQLAQLLVVGVAVGDRLLEDRRVRGDADDGVFAHQPRKLAALEQLAREVVDPDGLAELGQPLQRANLRHGSPRRRARLCVTGFAGADQLAGGVDLAEAIPEQDPARAPFAVEVVDVPSAPSVARSR